MHFGNDLLTTYVDYRTIKTVSQAHQLSSLVLLFVFGTKCMPVYNVSMLCVTGDIHKHLYSMCGLLRPSDNIKLVSCLSFCIFFAF